VRDTHIDGCSACGGVWLDKGELQGLANRQMDLWVAARTFKPTAAPRAPAHERVCPSCNVRLEAFEYASLAGIELDRCLGCGGIWVDDGELDQIDVRLA
jgi:Zn-finger nucleic acid-binding protein